MATMMPDFVIITEKTGIMWQPVLMINGFLIFILGAFMLVPAVALKYFIGSFDPYFIRSAFFSMFIGGSLFLAYYGKITKISVLQGYLITVSCWFICPFFCALPFYGNGDILQFSDALFEATSGLTTTGSTILSDIEGQPKSVLLWRALLHGVSGVGIVIFAVALMPFLGIGGTYIFNKENSDTEEKFLPKMHYIAKDIIITYILLNIICMFLLKNAGMDWFDAICHALATLSTGGLSTKNNSIAYFNSAKIETIITIFMLLGSLPMTYFILVTKRRNLTSIFGNQQVNTFLKFIFGYILIVSIFRALKTDIPFWISFRYAAFNMISAISTTGFSSCDFIKWGSWVVGVFLILFMTGGCTGSTSGSIKIFRWQVIFAFFKKNAINSLSPNQVAVMKAGGKVIDDKVVSSVFVMVVGFVLAIVFFTLIITMTGVDFVTALGAATANITNAGLGLTEATGPSGNFAGFTPFVKYLLAFIMVLGRLEVIAVFVLLQRIRFLS